MDAFKDREVEDIANAQREFENYEDALNKAMENSLLNEEIVNEEAKNVDRGSYEMYGISQENNFGRNDENVIIPPEFNRPRPNNTFDIRDYDIDNNLDGLLLQSNSERAERNRRRNERQNFNIGGARRVNQHRDIGSSDLLADLPPNAVRERINNPFINIIGERVQLREPRQRVVMRGIGIPRISNRQRPNRRPRRENNQRLEVDIDNMNYDELLELENGIGHVNKGYTKQNINSIPIMYSFQKEKSSCPICLDDIEAEMPMLSIYCRHEFHLA